MSQFNPPISTGIETFEYRGHTIEVKRYVSAQYVNLFVRIDGKEFNLAPFNSLSVALELAKEHIDTKGT